MDREEEAKKVADFMTYLKERDNEEFYGTFADWLREVCGLVCSVKYMQCVCMVTLSGSVCLKGHETYPPAHMKSIHPALEKKLITINIYI